MDTRNLSGLPPLRAAIIQMLDAHHVGVYPSNLVESVGVAMDRAKAYLSILTKQKVLVCRGGFYTRGARFEDWSTSICRSRPRGSGHGSQDKMDAIFERVSANVLRLRTERGWSMRTLAEKCGLHHEVVRRLETKHRRNVPFPALMLIAQALGTTVEELATNC